ncbi:MAG: formate dehydrogenase accessory protein FdhE [Deltaproteobacteria bacterium]|nr:formate dehydrogenase accessory protein FdhE [Deltaproteobacteria bacterium]
MTSEWLHHIDRLISQRPFSKQILEAYRELVVLMTESEPPPPQVALDEKLRPIRRTQGFPLFQRSELPVDIEGSRRLLERFFEHLSNSSRSDREAMGTALLKARERPDGAERLLRSFLSEDVPGMAVFCGETGLELKVVEFLAMNALKPSLIQCGRAYSKHPDLKLWDRGYCPLCGSQPAISSIDKSGKRALHCSLCGTQWGYPRLKCPFCAEEEHSKLGYFRDERLEYVRVDYCHGCERYVKVIDLRSVEEPAPMELENLSTIYLDVLAVERGFS